MSERRIDQVVPGTRFVRVRHVDIALGLAAIILLALALSVEPSLRCGIFQRSEWFIVLAWGSFGAFSLASLLSVACRRRVLSKVVVCVLGLLATAIASLALWFAGHPTEGLTGFTESRATPAYSTVQRIARDVPAGKAIYWLGPEFGGGRIRQAIYPDVWNIGGYSAESVQQEGVQIQYMHAPHQAFDWAVYVITYRGVASALPGGRGSDVILHMNAGQDVRLRFWGSLHPTRGVIAQIRANLQPIPRNVRCIE